MSSLLFWENRIPEIENLLEREMMGYHFFLLPTNPQKVSGENIFYVP